MNFSQHFTLIWYNSASQPFFFVAFARAGLAPFAAGLAFLRAATFTTLPELTPKSPAAFPLPLPLGGALGPEWSAYKCVRSTGEALVLRCGLPPLPNDSEGVNINEMHVWQHSITEQLSFKKYRKEVIR